MIPRATYRMQFHAAFTFADGAGLADYLARLGVSHLYSSPILHARAGSCHGYDVVDHRRINPELGGEDGFRQMATDLRAHGLGIILDIVPNHMAVGGADNPWWLDVLEKGAASPFAHYFDIDWSPENPALRNKILAPFLGSTYGEVLNAGEIRLIWDDALGRLTFAYHDHRFPLRATDYAEICGGDAPQDADLSAWQAPDPLHRLLERQHFRLAWWRTASDQINWRRFFTINELAALRVEDPPVFEATHAKVLDLYAEGAIDGVRIDHIDGLGDPGHYCRLLRQRLRERTGERPADARDGEPYIIVEKILARGEALPADWQVAGTTGYDFMNDVSAVQHAGPGAEPLRRLWAEVSGRPPGFEDEERLARGQVLVVAFGGALDALVRACQGLAPESIAAHDVTAPALRRALISLAGDFRAYRTYATGQEDTVEPGPCFEDALAAALARAGPVDSAALRYLDDAMFGADVAASPARAHAVRLFNQLMSPLAAKAVEDTAFYRYGRLLSRNDVGFEAAEFTIEPDEFHERAKRRLESAPHGLLATATHDHKRGEDARARLAVISEIWGVWTDAVRAWFDLNARLRPPQLDPGDEYQLYQALVGSWPLGLRADEAAELAAFASRIQAWRRKSLREAKLHTSWADPDQAFEGANDRFVAAILDPVRSPNFLRSFEDFVRRIAPAGALNGLGQVTLRCTMPGVPDLYQGTEFWDFSLVDPDNRRPVDYGARVSALAGSASLADALKDWQGGRVKQLLIARLLALRTEHPTLFAEGDYQPVPVGGARSANVLAFLRRTGPAALLVAVPRLCASAAMEAGSPLPAPGFWGDTALIADGSWRDGLSGAMRADLSCSGLFAEFPVAVLLRAG